jgi:hypothetical protein
MSRPGWKTDHDTVPPAPTSPATVAERSPVSSEKNVSAAPKETVPPEESPEQKLFDSKSVLSGVIYKIRVELLSEISCPQKIVLDVGYDNCGG